MPFGFLRFRGREITNARLLGEAPSEEVEKIRKERGCARAAALRLLSLTPDGARLIDAWRKHGAVAPPEASR